MSYALLVLYRYALSGMRLTQYGDSILKTHGIYWWKIVDGNIHLISNPDLMEKLKEYRRQQCPK